MRNRTSFALALGATLLVAPALSAQSTPFELSLLVEPAGSYSDYEGFDFDLGYGLGLGWKLSDAWSVELRGIRRESDSRFESLRLDTYQLGLRRSFALASSWHPFVQLGAHYQTGDIETVVFCASVVGPCPTLRSSRDEPGAFVGGGVDWDFASRAALRFDGRLVVYDSDATGDNETSTDLTAGIVFRF